MTAARVHRPPIAVRLAFILALALLGATAGTAGALSLSDKPSRCGVGCWGDGRNQLAVSYIADFEIGPAIVRPGDRITGRVTRTRPDLVKGWTWPSPFRCAPDTEICSAKAGGPTGGWARVSMSWANPIGAARTDATYAVLGKRDGSFVQGRVRDLDGDPVPGVTVLIRGANSAKSPTTDADGVYFAKVQPGTHVVRPRLADKRFAPARRRVRVRRDDTATANFVLAERERAEFVAFASTDRRYVLSNDTFTVSVEITNVGKKAGDLRGVQYATRGSARVDGAVAAFVDAPARLEPGGKRTVSFTVTATPTTVRATVAGTDLDLQATHNPLAGVLGRAVGTTETDAGPRQVTSEPAYTWVDVGQRGALRAAVAGSGTTLRQWLRTSSDVWALVRTEDGRQAISQSAQAAFLRASQTVQELTPAQIAELYLPVVGPRRAKGNLAAARKLKRDFVQLNALLAAGNHEALSERAGRVLPGLALEALVAGPPAKVAAPAIKRGFAAITGPATKGVRRKVNAARRRYGIGAVGAKDWRDATSGSRTTRGFENGAGWKQSDLDELERRARETGESFILFPRVATTRRIWNKGPELKTKAVDWKSSWDHLLGYDRRSQGLVVWRKPERPPAALRLVTTAKEWRDLNARYRTRLADFNANRAKVARWRRDGEIPVAELDWASNGVDPSRLTPELVEASRGRTLPFRIDEDGVMHVDGLPVGSDPDIAHVGVLGADLPQDALVSTYAYLRQSLGVRHFDSGRWMDLSGRRSLLAGVTQKQRGAAIAVTPDGRFVTRVADHSKGDASWVAWEGLATTRR
jgi:hypothetical protein